MAANRFDQAAEMPIINTYIPIDFSNLYQIGAAQKQTVDRAINDLNEAIVAFGQFRSPSSVDTQRYYDLSLGRMQGLIDEVAANPDSIKDSSFRSRLFSNLNSLDYAKLSMLKESADNLRLGLKTRAKMEAKGLYNKNWDESDIASYDTLTQGRVFDDITPIAYMNANQLSDAYFDNMKPGTIRHVYRDGVKYIATGNTVEDLEAVANAHMSDLIATPQGQMYMKDFLRRRNGDYEKAEEDFKDMIVASQMSRTLRPTLTVDPAWLASFRASLSDRKEQQGGWPTRLDYIQSSFTKKGARNVANLSTPEEAKQQNAEAKTLWEEYIIAKNKADQSGTKEDQIAAAQAQNDYYEYTGGITRRYNRQAVLEGFKEAAGFSAENVDVDGETYSNDKYLSGIQRGLRNVEQTVALTGQKEAMLTGLNATPNRVVNKDGGATNVFEFNDSRGFILPETVFKQVVSDGEDMPLRGEVTRHAGLFRSNAFPFQELLERGNFSNVQFIPDGGIVQNGTYDYALRGKIRIPRSQIEQYLGTGVWGNAGSESSTSSIPMIIASAADYGMAPLGRYSTIGNLEDKYNAKVVTEKINEEDVDYVEVDAYRQLPNAYYDGEWWKSTLQMWQNSPSTGGIGGSSQAKESYPTTDFL